MLGIILYLFVGVLVIMFTGGIGYEVVRVGLKQPTTKLIKTLVITAVLSPVILMNILYFFGLGQLII
jgi:succinate dehydrogenase hydrophobic anchor subunit